LPDGSSTVASCFQSVYSPFKVSCQHPCFTCIEEDLVSQVFSLVAVLLSPDYFELVIMVKAWEILDSISGLYHNQWLAM